MFDTLKSVTLISFHSVLLILLLLRFLLLLILLIKYYFYAYLPDTTTILTTTTTPNTALVPVYKHHCTTLLFLLPLYYGHCYLLYLQNVSYRYSLPNACFFCTNVYISCQFSFNEGVNCPQM